VKKWERASDVRELILVALDCVLLDISYSGIIVRLNCRENACTLCITEVTLRNCLLVCHSSDVHLLTQVVYVSRDSYVNICIPRKSWKGLANQLSVNRVMFSCMTHS
jgi:hypothetical protein